MTAFAIGAPTPGARHVPVELLPHQLQLVADRTSPIIVMSGGLRSGKTTGSFWKAVDLCDQNWPLPTLITEPTYRMLNDAFVETAVGILNKHGIPYKFHKGEYTLTIAPDSDRPLRMWLRSLDRPENMIAITVGAAVVDEWEQCGRTGRMRVRERITQVEEVKCPQLCLIGTKEGWGDGYEFTEKNPPPGLRVINAKTSENRFVDPSYVRELRSMMTEAEARERLDGIRTARDGNVYSRFNKDRALGLPCLGFGEGEIKLFADFNVELMAWGAAYVDEHGRRAHVFGEIVTKNTDTSAQAEYAANFLADHISRMTGKRVTRDDIRDMRIKVVIDASGAARSAIVPLSHVSVLLSAGFQPIYPSSNPRVEDRITSLNLMLAHDPARLTIDAEKAPYIARCVQSQPYDSHGKPDKSPKLGLDHGADALGYLVHWHWPAWLPRANEVHRPYVYEPIRD